MSATSISVLAAAHEEWASEQKADSFFDSTDCTKLFYKSNAKYQAGGGLKVVWSAEVAQAATAEAIASGGTLAAVGTTEFMKRAELDWKFLAIAAKRDKQDFDVYNAGEASQVNLYKGWLDNIKQSMMELMGDQIWSNTVGASDLISLCVAIDGIPPTTPGYVPQTYAGLAPATYTKWVSYRRDLTTTSVGISDLVEAINDIRFRRKGKADLIVCGFEDYLAIENEGLGAVRHPSVSAGSTTELGLPTFTVHGAKVVVDRFLDAEPANGGAPANSPLGFAGNKKVYVLSTDQIAWIAQPKEKLVGYKTIEGSIQMSNLVDRFPLFAEMTYQVAMETGGVLMAANRRPHAVITHV